jgi:DNA-binding transcriptional MerR regulator
MSVRSATEAEPEQVTEPVQVTEPEQVTEPMDAPACALRIGEAAKACGLTTRTLRYWDEIGLLTPSEKREGGERLYSAAEVERAARIKELQDLLGFSLAEIRVVLETEDILDGWRSAKRANAQPEIQRRLLAEAIDANDKLVARLDDTLGRIRAYRDERADKAERLRERSRQLEAGTAVSTRDDTTTRPTLNRKPTVNTAS